jgi:hypothetical protein
MWKKPGLPGPEELLKMLEARPGASNIQLTILSSSSCAFLYAVRNRRSSGDVSVSTRFIKHGHG